MRKTIKKIFLLVLLTSLLCLVPSIIPTTASEVETLLSDVVQVSTGRYHSIFLTSKKEVFTVGYNYYGQLGDGTFTRKVTPVNITSNFNLQSDEFVTAISAGAHHNLGLTNLGNVYSFGFYMALGIKSSGGTSKNTPQNITENIPGLFDDKPVQIACGNENSYILTQNGRLFSFGRGSNGELGNGMNFSEYLPIEITDKFSLDINEKINNVFAGYSQVFVTTNINCVYAFGENSQYQLGIESITDVFFPRKVFISPEISSANEIISITPGSLHTLLLTKDGDLYTVGHNYSGQLGTGDNESRAEFTSINAVFTKVINGKITKIAAGSDTSYIATDTGRVYAFGLNQFGSLGLKLDGSNNKPVEISYVLPKYLTDGIKLIEANEQSAFVLSNAGIMYSFGSNEYGQLCNGKNDYITEPVEVTDLNTLLAGDEILDIVNGKFSGVILTRRGRVFTYGGNKSGQIGIFGNYYKNPITEITNQFVTGSSSDKVISVSMRGSSGIALTMEGRIFTWGSNAYGNLGDGTHVPWNVAHEVTYMFKDLLSGEKITHIEAGEFHSFALTNLGRVYGFGDTDFGQLGVIQTLDFINPTDITSEFRNLKYGERVTSVFAAYYGSYFLTDQGRLFVSGLNNRGQFFTNNTEMVDRITEVTGNFPNMEYGEKIIQVAGTVLAGFALTNLGKVYSVGNNSDGQLGNGSNYDSLMITNITKNFVGISSYDKITELSVGYNRVVALTEQGKLYGFGRNYFGELGSLPVSNNLPVQLTDQFVKNNSTDKIILVECGDSWTMVVTNKDKVYFCGWNVYGQMPSTRVDYINTISVHSKLEQDDIYTNRATFIRIPYGATPLALPIMGGSGNGELVFSNSKFQVASVDSNGVIKPNSVGTTIITVKKLGDDLYNESNTLIFEIEVYNNPVVSQCNNSGKTGFILAGCMLATLYIFVLKGKKNNAQ